MKREMNTLFCVILWAVGAVAADSPSHRTVTQDEISKLNALRSVTNSVIVQKAYKSFFEQFDPPPSNSLLSKEYAEHAYRFHKILLSGENREQAASFLQLAIESNTDPHVNRRLLVELAELYIKMAEDAKDEDRVNLLNKARHLLGKTLW